MITSSILSKQSTIGKIRLFCTVLLNVSLLGATISRAAEIFPTPSALKQNVEFWTKIYSQYSTNHVIIHDNNDLSIIYKVVNLDRYFANEEDNRTKWKKIEEIKDEYRAILQRLSERQTPIPLDSLTSEERHVYILWAHHHEVDKFRKASGSIRGQLGLRDRFEKSVQRSGAIFDHIIETLENYGLPADLAYLPHVESLYDYNSYSKVGAVGLWQFIRHTGRLFMTINSSIDERCDPFAATEAAAKLLKLNMDELQSWPLAITAYNHGLSGMKNAVSKTGSRDFGDIFLNYKSSTFGFASRNFYAEFLAARQVAKNYKSYFGEIELDAPVLYQTIIVPNNVYLRNLASILDLPEDSLIVYNPAFRWGVTQNKRAIPSGYLLRLPYREGYDPREVFVQSTEPAPLQPKRQRTIEALFSFNLTASDTLGLLTEADVLNLLKNPLPSLINRNATTEKSRIIGEM